MTALMACHTWKVIEASRLQSHAEVTAVSCKCGSQPVGVIRGSFHAQVEHQDTARCYGLDKHRHNVTAKGHRHFLDQAISDNSKPCSPEPDAAFVANQLVIIAAAKFSDGDQWGALADLAQADQLQPNDLATLQLRAVVRLDLDDMWGFLEDVDGRTDLPLFLLMWRGEVSGGIGDNEQALKDLIAADQLSPGVADDVCKHLEDLFTAAGGPDLSEVTALRHNIQTKLKDMAQDPTSAVNEDEPASDFESSWWGGCTTEHKQLAVALMQFTEQGMHLEARRTLTRMIALFAVMHCFGPEDSEFSDQRRLDQQQELATCMGHLGLATPSPDPKEWPLYGHPADNSLYVEQLGNQSFAAENTSKTQGIQHLLTANTLYTQKQYSAALDEVEQANALMPHHYTVLHLRGMCKAELQEYEDAITDLTGRAHYCNALFSRGMCHMNLGNHEKAFDDILRADVLDSRSGESFYRVMKRFAATDPGNPGVQKAAELCAALEKRKMKCLKAVDDNSRLEQQAFVQNLDTLATLLKKGDDHTVCVILNEIIEHLDPFSPNIREQAETINEVNEILHQQWLVASGHQPQPTTLRLQQPADPTPAVTT